MLHKLWCYLYDIFFKDALTTSVQFVITDGTTTYRTSTMTIQLNDSQKVTLTVAETSAAGNAVPFTNTPTYVSSDESVATVSTTGPNTADVVATGKVGVATITVSVDNLTATADVEVVAGPVATLTITNSDPVSK